MLAANLDTWCLSAHPQRLLITSSHVSSAPSTLNTLQTSLTRHHLWELNRSQCNGLFDSIQQSQSNRVQPSLQTMHFQRPIPAVLTQAKLPLTKAVLSRLKPRLPPLFRSSCVCGPCETGEQAEILLSWHFPD